MAKDIKIDLVIPKDSFLDDEKRNFPLGIFYIASTARALGYDVSVDDLRGVAESELEKHLNPDCNVYGFTSTTPSYHIASTLAKKIKHKNPEALTIIGGPHATALPHTIGHEFDKVVVGEGEKSFTEILKDYTEEKNLDKRIYSSPLIRNLDSIPFPARDLIPYESVFNKDAFVAGGEYTGTIMSSRGCIGDCSFCGSENMWHRKVRFRTPDNVVEELKYMIDNFGVRYFKFHDDTVAMNKKRMYELCDKIKPLDILWKACTRVDYSQLDMLKKMKQSGCQEVAFGIESLEQKVLDKNQKGTNLSQINEAMKNTKLAGLDSRLYFMIGLPGEPQGFSDRLYQFIDKARPDSVVISTFVPYPGTPIYNNPDKWGIKIKDVKFDKYLMSLGLREDERTEDLIFEHDILTNREIKEERIKSLNIVKEMCNG